MKQPKYNYMKCALFIFCLCFPALTIKAQKNKQFTVKASVDFRSPKKHKILDPIGYGEDGIIQFNGKKVKSFSFQKFTNDLKLQKENTVKTEDRLNKHVQFQKIVKFKNKTYLFVREVFKKTGNEGITALEFSPNLLNFVGTGKNLFKSSGKVVVGAKDMTGNVVYNTSHEMIISKDQATFMCSYTIVPKEKRDRKNKEIIGIHVFDENLKKLWGREYEMPFTEAMMDNLGFTVSDNGNVYLLTRVFDNEKRKASKDGKPNYHYEVFEYNGDNKPHIMEINLNEFFPLSSYIYEDPHHNIVVAGFYSKGIKSIVDGAFMIKLDINGKNKSKAKGVYYEIPNDVLKAYNPDWQKGKKQKKGKKEGKKGKGKDEDELAEETDFGIWNLQIRGIYNTPDGSTKIVSEQYQVVSHTYYDGKTTRTVYDTYANDMYVFSIDSAGALSWVKKIPKDQHAGDARGAQLSLKTYIIDNTVYIFYIDNPKNLKLPETEAPAHHENGFGGFLTVATITPDGEVKKSSLAEIAKFETNFYIRYFVDGRNNNLISTERRKKKNMLFSIVIKPN